MPFPFQLHSYLIFSPISTLHFQKRFPERPATGSQNQDKESNRRPTRFLWGRVVADERGFSGKIRIPGFRGAPEWAAVVTRPPSKPNRQRTLTFWRSRS